MLPLYANKRLKDPSKMGNRGLYFNKFVHLWPDHAPLGNFEGLGEKRKCWVAEFEKETGNKEQIENTAKRIALLAKALSGGREPVAFQTEGPFVTGMGLEHPVENGFLWHHTLGVPYLPGSSIKGMIRAWAGHWLKDRSTVVDRLFGRDDKHDDGASAGGIIVFDAVPTGPVKLAVEIITPHDGGWRIKNDVTPSDWVSPNPIPFLAVAAGAQFQFALAPRKCVCAGGDLEIAYQYLEQALKWIGAGAKTAVGFGRFDKSSDIPPEEKRPR